MGFLRRPALWLSTSLLFTSLIMLVYSWIFVTTFADRNVVKGWIEDSGTYDSVVTEIIKLSETQAQEQGTTVSTATLDLAANTAFTPELLQKSAEAFFDGAYDWIEGNQPALRFSIDLTEAKLTFAESLTQSADEILSSLPVCPDGEIVAKLDPFAATCVPRGFDFSLSSDAFAQSIADSEDFLPNTVLTEQDAKITIDGEQQTISERLSFIPLLFSIAQFGTLIFFCLGVLAIGLIFKLTSTPGRAFFRLFRAFLVTTISLAIFTFVTSRSTAWLESTFGQNNESQEFSQNVILPVVQTASRDITSITLVFTWIFGVISLVILLSLFLLRYLKSLEPAKPTPKPKPAKKAKPKNSKKTPTIADLAENAKKKKKRRPASGQKKTSLVDKE